MMKKNNGITLMALIITVVVMTILTGVGFELTYTEIKKVKDSRLQSELGIIKQAVTEQYFKAVTLNKTTQLATEAQDPIWIGERVTSDSPILLPVRENLDETDESIAFYEKVNNHVVVYQEDCYYRLSPSDQAGMGITDSKDVYIVNYGTGEVYNESEKITSAFQLLYLPGNKHAQEKKAEDTTTFNDWE